MCYFILNTFLWKCVTLIILLRYPTVSDPIEILSIFPVLSFGYQCHMTSVPLYAELRNRSLSKYTCMYIVQCTLSKVYNVHTTYTCIVRIAISTCTQALPYIGVLLYGFHIFHECSYSSLDPIIIN